jgi:hypothetical protein
MVNAVQRRQAILAGIGNGLLSGSSRGLNACRGALIPMQADQDYDYDYDPAGETRAHGLRRLSRLTWRATQLGALTTVGFALLFARTAPAATVNHPAPKATANPSPTASPSPSPSPTPSAHRHRHHHHHKPPAAPAGAAAPAPAQSLAPPTTPPAPPPPPPSPAPSPVQTTSSGSHGGG